MPMSLCYFFVEITQSRTTAHSELNVDYLTRLAMVGMHPAQEVVVCVNISLSMASEVQFENVTYITTSECQHPAISVMPTGNKIQKLSVINSYLKASKLHLSPSSYYL